jgi:hypothetical protein
MYQNRKHRRGIRVYANAKTCIDLAGHLQVPHVSVGLGGFSPAVQLDVLDDSDDAAGLAIYNTIRFSAPDVGQRR